MSRTTPLAERVCRQFEDAVARSGATVADGVRARIQEVVIIASSSRGGSSVLAELLRRTPQLLHLRAEANPFFVLAGLSYPESGAASDALESAEPHRLDVLDRLLAADIGVACDDEVALERFCHEVAARLVLQWPALDIDAAHVASVARATLHDADPRADNGRFIVLLLERLRASWPAMNTWYYDVPPALIEEISPTLPIPGGPPGEWLVEEPPFVTVRPWRLADDADFARRALVVKTPSNVYRLPFLRAFFPKARFRVLHLCRNAAASINGLVDGWRYRGFFSHRVDPELRIEGYSDVFGAWARHWWKYDLPPGWEDHARRPLVDVCAFQWWSAHHATLSFLERAKEVDVLRVHFEDIVGSFDRRERVLREMARWLGIHLDAPLQRALATGMPPVMATTAPRQRRWFQKAEMLDTVLALPHIREMMERLGYADDPQTWE